MDQRRHQIGIQVGRAPLGFRLWDLAKEQFVTDGMRLMARPADSPELPAAVAVLAGRDRYVFPALPGAPVPAGPEEAVRKRTFAVGIYDLLGRFLPVALRVDLPYGTTGLYPERKTTSDTPGRDGNDKDLPRFPLFSAPTRLSLPGMAVFRGEVWDGVNGRPAAHAVVRIKLGRVARHLDEDHDEAGAYYSLTDVNGRLCLMFPLPPVINGKEQDLEATVWIRYQRQPLPTLTKTALSLVAPQDLPELGAITQQPPALMQAAGEAPQPYFLTRLIPKRDTILRAPSPHLGPSSAEAKPGSVFVVYPT